MLLFRKNEPHALRPLAPVTKTAPPPSLEGLPSTRFFKQATSYFKDYPARSLMSDESRAVLFSLIRILRPTYIAEIGTFMAGTTEVMARACWENNWGIVYTTDPFGGERCPPVIAEWPEDLGKYVSFHPLSSMDFFHYLNQRQISLDMTLVDGNHDYEFALFDLQMAARRSRPSAIIVLDNAEQSGPYKAARDFLALQPLWREIGDSVATADPSTPFDPSRASLPDTSFILLQAPPHLFVDRGPRSWAQKAIEGARVAGLTFVLSTQRTAGTLHYQVIFRAFRQNAAPLEAKAIGRLRIEAADATTIEHRFRQALELPDNARYTIEVDLSWQADAGNSPLALSAAPEPIVG